jgi:hypothetical protein
MDLILDVAFLQLEESNENKCTCNNENCTCNLSENSIQQDFDKIDIQELNDFYNQEEINLNYILTKE